jgi:hypothetical protein
MSVFHKETCEIGHSKPSKKAYCYGQQADSFDFLS